MTTNNINNNLLAARIETEILHTEVTCLKEQIEHLPISAIKDCIPILEAEASKLTSLKERVAIIRKETKLETKDLQNLNTVTFCLTQVEKTRNGLYFRCLRNKASEVLQEVNNVLSSLLIGKGEKLEDKLPSLPKETREDLLHKLTSINAEITFAMQNEPNESIQQSWKEIKAPIEELIAPLKANSPSIEEIKPQQKSDVETESLEQLIAKLTDLITKIAHAQQTAKTPEERAFFNALIKPLEKLFFEINADRQKASVVVTPITQPSLEMKEVKLNTKGSSIGDLSQEILREIFYYSPREQHADLLRICKQWLKIGDDSHLYRELLLYHFGVKIATTSPMDYKKLYQNFSNNINLRKGRFTTQTIELEKKIISSLLDCSFIASKNTFITQDLTREEIKIWDLKNGTCLKEIKADQHDIDLNKSLLSQDNESLFFRTKSSPYKINSLNLFSGESKTILSTSLLIADFVFSQDEKRCYVSNIHEILIFDMKTQSQIGKLTHQLRIGSFVLSHDEKRMIIMGYDSSWKPAVEIWDLEKEKCIKTLSLKGSRHKKARLSPDEKSLVVLSGNLCRILDIETEEIIEDLSSDEISPPSFDIIQNTLVVYGKEKVTLFDLKRRQVIFSLTFDYLKGAANVVKSFFSPEKRQLIRLVDSPTGTQALVHNFLVTNEEVFTEIADQLMMASKNVKQLLDRFMRMPLNEREKIYEEMSQIKPSPSYWGTGENIFHNLHGLSSTPQEKAQAIYNYLKKKLT